MEASPRPPDSDSAPISFDDPPAINLSSGQTEKVNVLAAILKCSHAEAAKHIYRRAMAGLPNHAYDHYLLPDLDIRACARVGEDLIRIDLAGGRTFFGQRSEQKEYLLYQMFRPRLPEIVTGDSYKLALDIQKRYFGTHLTPHHGPGGTFVEGGCFTGMKAIRWHDLAQGAVRIIAVEIGRTNFEILRLNIEANGLSQSIVPVHAGLWRESGEGTQRHAFSTRRFLESTDRWSEHMVNEEPVRLLTMDDLFAEHGVAIADFVNIQVNGAELQVLEGIRDAWSRIKVIGIAAYYSHEGKAHADLVEDHLQSVGCTILRRTTSGRITAVTPAFRDEAMARMKEREGRQPD